MTRNGDAWVALYDGENRLRTVSHPYDGVELLYDYAGRIYQVNDFYMDGVDLPTSTLNYRRIYDGTKLIATVRNGEIQDTFVWQPETSGDADVILWDNSYVYATDPNKNVRVKRFPNDWIPGTWVEEFIDYKPFGELKNYVANPPRFMFSSEEYMPETGMYHYLYRAYSPSLARFITRDPIEEQGGVNLYCFVGNNPISRWDLDGLETTDECCGNVMLKQGECCHNDKVIKCNTDIKREKNQKNCCILLENICLTGAKYIFHQNIEIMDSYNYSYGLKNGWYYLSLFAGISRVFNSAKVYNGNPAPAIECIAVPRSYAKSLNSSLEAMVNNATGNYSIFINNCRGFSQTIFENAKAMEYKGDLPECNYSVRDKKK